MDNNLHGSIEHKFAVTDETRTLSGYGARFNNTDGYGDVIEPGAFTKSLAEHQAAGTSPAMLFNHRALDLPIGVWTTLEEDDQGLKVEGTFLETSTGTDTYKAVKAGAISGLSIGYIVTAYDVDRTGDFPIRRITAAKLLEVSVVNFPANELARVESVKMQPESEANTDLGTEEEAETKYNQAAFDAVENFIRELKQENYGR